MSIPTLPENTYSINLPTDKTYYWKVVVLDGGVAVHDQSRLEFFDLFGAEMV